jgi:transcriptional regulator with AAA-type ATPase domain
MAVKPAPSNWLLCWRPVGQPPKSLPLIEGANLIGRDPDCQIPLPDSSVSRHHAEVLCKADGVTVRDLDSRNGLRVNGVPRKRAVLQPGDKIEICDFLLELAPAFTSATSEPALAPSLASALRVEQTHQQRLRLPEPASERQLATLYHTCFWIAESLEEQAFVERCLNLLLECFRAAETHLYSVDLEREAVAAAEGKPVVKLAAFLAKRFQETVEATVIRGESIGKHQRGVGNFNYLVGPLRAEPTRQPVPFLVVIRSSDQQDFSAEDRVLLQAICQLWVRGLAKTNRLQELRVANEQLREKVGSAFLGSSPAIQRLREQARKAASTHAAILLTGETGSGKEVLAQFIHDSSPRRDGPLVKVNCAAIPDSLIESELFGFAKGAFSGANQDHRGKFAQAHAGTLFLDEVGEMPLLVQAKVLRAIETREITPLGSETAQQSDLRIIAATNKDLRALVRQKEFREDLYYRLDVQRLRVPPLREHLEDLEELAPHFLNRFCLENGLAEMVVQAEALEILKEHSWPGNVRELWNVVQRCALAAEDRQVSAEIVREQLRLQEAN